MPAEGLDWLPGPALLTDDESSGSRGRGQRLGITEVRFTGGEPLLRRGLPGIVARRGAAPAARDLADHQRHRPDRLAGPLRRGRAGPDERLARHPVPRDVQDPDAPRPAPRVLAGWPPPRGRADPGQDQRGADARRQRPRGPGLLRFCLDTATSSGSSSRCPWTPSTAGGAPMVTADEILDAPGRQFTLAPRPGRRGTAPAETFLVDGGPGACRRDRFGHPAFCGACDRIRLTADGQVRNCLFASAETDLRPCCAPAPATRSSRRVAPRHRRQAARPRHQRPRIPAAGPAHVRHRRLTDAAPATAGYASRASRNRIEADI